MQPEFLPAGSAVGPYAIVEVIGWGGAGVVYKVSKGTERFALKMLHAELLGGPRGDVLSQRLAREFSALKSLDHIYLPRVHDHAEHAGVPYIVMDLIEGLHLDEWIADERPPLRDALGIILRLCDALAELHKRGVLHRDIKPSNIHIRVPDGLPFLLDFGLCRPRDAVALTGPRDVDGTFEYLPPEAAAHCLATLEEGTRGMVWQASSDVYQMGVVLYEVLTGKRPYRHGPVEHEVFELVREIRDVVPPHPSTVHPGAPRVLGDIVMRCLEKDPAQRFQDGKALYRALDEVFEAAGPSAWQAPGPIPVDYRRRMDAAGQRPEHLRVVPPPADGATSSHPSTDRFPTNERPPSTSKRDQKKQSSAKKADGKPERTRSPSGGVWKQWVALGVVALLLILVGLVVRRGSGLSHLLIHIAWDTDSGERPVPLERMATAIASVTMPGVGLLLGGVPFPDGPRANQLKPPCVYRGQQLRGVAALRGGCFNVYSNPSYLIDGPREKCAAELFDPPPDMPERKAQCFEAIQKDGSPLGPPNTLSR